MRPNLKYIVTYAVSYIWRNENDIDRLCKSREKIVEDLGNIKMYQKWK